MSEPHPTADVDETDEQNDDGQTELDPERFLETDGDGHFLVVPPAVGMRPETLTIHVGDVVLTVTDLYGVHSDSRVCPSVLAYEYAQAVPRHDQAPQEALP